MPQLRTTVHWVLLLGTVQEQGPADAIPHHGEGPVRALPTRIRSACNRPLCLTPALPIANIFVLMGDIVDRGRRRGSTGRSGRTQDPQGQRKWGRLIRGKNQGRWRGDAQRDGGGEEGDGRDKDDGGTGKHEMERDGGSQVRSNRAGGKYRAEGTDQGESADKSAEWSGKETERSATEEEAETARGYLGGKQDKDGDITDIERKRRRTAIREHSGRRGRHLGGHLRGCRRGGSGRPPWGETREKREGSCLAGKPGWQVLRSGGQ